MRLGIGLDLARDGTLERRRAGQDGFELGLLLNNQQTSSDPSNISRTLPTFTVDSSVIFERETSVLDKPFIQTLEPRLYYVNIPYKDQSDIPIFDTYQSDFNFAQIFSENRYSGYDRINDANQLTAALTTRVLDGETGVEKLRAMVGQVYYFRPGKVTLPRQSEQPEGYASIIPAGSGLVMPKTYPDVAWEYSYRDSVNERFSIDALTAEAQRIAARLAANPPLVVAGIKRTMNARIEADVARSNRDAAIQNGLLIQSDDFAEAMRAFMDRREPVFKGR